MLTARMTNRLKRHHVIEWDHSRAQSMTAERFREGCRSAGLACIGQEIIDWGQMGRKTIDCISLVARPGSNGTDLT
jgi:hypothetical protein